MPQPDLRVKAIARLISNIGHPFVLVTLFILYITFHYRLFFASAILLLALILIILLTVRRVKQGKATDMDVSVREQRYHLYVLTALSLMVVIVVLWLTGQSPHFILGTGAALVLVIIAGVLNLNYKVSLHTAFSFFIAFSLLPMNTTIAAAVAVWSILVGISRVIVKRHMKSEVIIGGLLGLGIGAVYYYLQDRL